MADDWIYVIPLIGYAILVLPAMLRSNREPRVALRNIAAWLAILVAALVLYRATH